MIYIDWPAKAEEAERIHDWDESKRCWYYAAQALNGNPHELRTYYGQREDAAAECRKMAAKLRGET